MKKVTGPVHLSSRTIGLLGDVFEYLLEIIHFLSRGSFGTALAYAGDRHFVFPPLGEGPLVLITGTKQDQGPFAFAPFTPSPGFLVIKRSHRFRGFPYNPK